MKGLKLNGMDRKTKAYDLDRKGLKGGPKYIRLNKRPGHSLAISTFKVYLQSLIEGLQKWCL
jgi:hypothetical protein